jgi:hypothetical protein
MRCEVEHSSIIRNGPISRLVYKACFSNCGMERLMEEPLPERVFYRLWTTNVVIVKKKLRGLWQCCATS